MRTKGCRYGGYGCVSVLVAILAFQGMAGLLPAQETAKLRVPPGFKAKTDAAAEKFTKTGWAEAIIEEKTGMELVFIPAGEFMMGSPVGEKAREQDETQHKVRITKPFYMGKYEVTQGEWRKVVGGNLSRFKGSDQLPVESLTWNNCQLFVRKLAAGGVVGLRLPTEAEWEYACRSGATTAYFFGDSRGEYEDLLGKFAWYFGNADFKTHVVGGKQPNAWGLYDMHGNVWEYCQDWYSKDYYEQSPAEDPQGPVMGLERVIRGGSWIRGWKECRCAVRNRFDPTAWNYDVGFRVVLDLKTPADVRTETAVGR